MMGTNTSISQIPQHFHQDLFSFEKTHSKCTTTFMRCDAMHAIGLRYNFLNTFEDQKVQGVVF